MQITPEDAQGGFANGSEEGHKKHQGSPPFFSLVLADNAHLQIWEVVTHRTVSPKLWKDNIEGLLHLKIGQLLVPKSIEDADQALIWSAAV